MLLKEVNMINGDDLVVKVDDEENEEKAKLL